MIVPMKRILLLCVEKDTESTLAAMRDLGAVHLDLSSSGGEERPLPEVRLIRRRRRSGLQQKPRRNLETARRVNRLAPMRSLRLKCVVKS